MARVVSFSPLVQTRFSLHPTEVECRVAEFEVHGHRFVQLSTYGSSDRQDEGTVSQTLQFGEHEARELRAILDRHFPPKGSHTR